MKSKRVFGIAALAAIGTAVLPHSAAALPGFFVSKTKEHPANHESHVVIMKKAEDTVITVMADYEGSLAPFALVLAVPSDVEPDRVSSLQRNYVNRVDYVSAPRFHEFWEMHACDPGEPVQEWERNLKASADTAFLGNMGFDTSKKVAKELTMDTEVKHKTAGEFNFTVLGDDQPLPDWLSEHGYKAPDGMASALSEAKAQRFLIAEVDTKRVELVGGDRAQLSPIQFWTEQPYDTVPSKLGLLSAPDHQELFLYVLHPNKRFQVKNYVNVHPPTNIEVDFEVKERVGEFYNALYDMILAKKPNAFLSEYAWPADGCGQPCATPALRIDELLSLGGDVFERNVSDEEKNPKPPELTEEEEAKQKAELEAIEDRKERREKEKEFKEDRKTIARNKALVERHKYILTRLHYRYDKSTLKENPRIGPAANQIEGGIWVPKGEDREISTDIKPSKQSHYQVRYINFHPSKKVIKCDKPRRWRWGKAGREVRVLRKIWVADDLTRKSRTQIKPSEVVRTPVPALGLLGGPKPAESGDAGADAGDAGPGQPKKDNSDCDCAMPGASRGGRGAFLLLLGLLCTGLSRRRTQLS